MRDAIERGLSAPLASDRSATGPSALPRLELRHPLRAHQFSNAALCELLDE